MKAIRVFTLAVGLLGAVLAAVAAVVKKSQVEIVNEKPHPLENHQGFAVVELFTSEGCSSCPPAEELVEKIQKSYPGDVYILSFHVDYWDHQGWKDKFSDPAFTERQKQYADWLRLQTLYTPQVVVNGATEYVGSHGGAILGAIAEGLDQASTKTLTLDGSVEGGKVNIHYQGEGDEKNAELVLALVQQSAQSNVRAGENSGRRLSHVQIVRRLVHVPLGADSRREIAIDLPSDFTKEGWEVIGFIQRKSDGRITAANRASF